MAGEISIKERNMKAELVTLVLVFAAAFVMTSLAFRRFDVNPVARGALSGLMAYVITRAGYGALYPGGLVRRIAWELTDTALVLDGNKIPRSSIRAVHCWPNRDAFGHTRPGWVVNIETGGKNTLLRSADARNAAEELEALVLALGGQVPVS